MSCLPIKFGWSTAEAAPAASELIVRPLRPVRAQGWRGGGEPVQEAKDILGRDVLTALERPTL